MKVNREYKDSIFRVLFNTPEKALQLYCDITGKVCDKDAVIDMKSLETVMLSKLRNDLSFVIDESLVVILEHQSTLNKNIPLRSLQYILLFYEVHCELGVSLYKEKLIKLPKPEFYLLYNGLKPYPPRGVMQLSDAFIDLKANEKPGLELIVNVMNINYDENAELLKKNSELKDYSIFVSRIRKRRNEGKDLDEAINITVKECLTEGVLAEFLHNHGNEVKGMLSLVYDEEKALHYAREEAMEEGMEKGREKGREEGMEKGKEEMARNLLANGIPSEIIAQSAGLPVERIQKLMN